MLRRRIGIESLESRRLMAADSIGVTPRDNGEFLLGSVAVTPVFFESVGGIDDQSQNWSVSEIDEVLGKLEEGMQWWADLLETFDTVHTLDFVYDETYARAPVGTGYEPIDRSSADYPLYTSEFFVGAGFDVDGTLESAAAAFNHSQRQALGTDWALTIFVVDSSDDPDGLFPAGGPSSGAFALPGGLFMVVPSTRPASTFAHEMGHLFWTRDEYPGGGSWTDTRGYYNAQNTNAWDNPTPGFVQQPSIMASGSLLRTAYDNHVSPADTLAMLGWRDSDGDGIFDVADVPLDLTLGGSLDADAGTYRVVGEAEAVPLRNLNSAGTQSDITLNRISRLEYRIDDGDWVTLATPDSQRAEFDLTLDVDPSDLSIEFRVIDDATGVTSESVQGPLAQPLASKSPLSGYAFVDGDSDGQFDAGESLLPGTSVTLTNADGTPLPSGAADARELNDGRVSSGEIDGIRLEAVASPNLAFQYSGRVGVFDDDTGTTRVFHADNQFNNFWNGFWSSDLKLRGELDQPAAIVDVSVMGRRDHSFARVTALDADGNVIARTTSDALAENQAATISIADPGGQIAAVEVAGHAGSQVAIESIDFGTPATTVADAAGVWRFDALPDGDYLAMFRPDDVIHQFDAAGLSISVGAGTPPVAAAAVRGDSSRHNTNLAADVNQDGGVTPRDALAVIIELSDRGAGEFSGVEIAGPKIDVNNDGAVSPLDALLVIIAIAEGDSEGESAGGVGSDAEFGSGSADGAGAGVPAGGSGSFSFVGSGLGGSPDDGDDFWAQWPDGLGQGFPSGGLF